MSRRLNLLNSTTTTTIDLEGLLARLTSDTWLDRAEGSAALRAAGFDISPTTLASKATRGGGPPYRVFMGVAKSRWGDLLAWAESRSVYRGGPLPTLQQGSSLAPLEAPETGSIRGGRAPPDAPNVRPPVGA
jgi:hypothetical protein